MLGHKSTRPRFEIWQTGARIHAVDNPVRLRILELLEQKDRSLTDLVLHTRKAKSTLSAVHMPPLVDAGVVLEQTDAKDSRVKRYHLVGHRLGSSDVSVPELRDAVLAYAQSSGTVPLPALLAILAPADLVTSGAKKAYVDAVANRIGDAVRRLITSSDAAEARREVNKLLHGAGLATAPTAARPAELIAPQAELQGFVETILKRAIAPPSPTPRASLSGLARAMSPEDANAVAAAIENRRKQRTQRPRQPGQG